MKPGLFEVADGGTLFIDEIGELALSLQAKLLRVLEDGSLRRVGSVKERRVRVRLIAATNRDLAEEVKEKRFREDLFYRINVLTIYLPPLRQREGDLPLLVEHLTGPEWHLDPDVIPTLERYSWPGNVRQLQNALDRAKILADDDQIRVENLPPEIVNSAHARPSSIPATLIWTRLRTSMSWKRTGDTRTIKLEPPERSALGGGLSIDSWKNIALRMPIRRRN